MGLPETTAAPIALEIKGQTFTLRPLNDEDYGVLLRWVRSQYLKVADDMSTTPEERETMRRIAFEKASQATLQSPEVLSHITTPEGTVMLMWLMARKDAKELQLSTVRGWLGDEQMVGSLLDAVNQLSPSGTDPNKKGVPRKRRRR